MASNNIFALLDDESSSHSNGAAKAKKPAAAKTQKAAPAKGTPSGFPGEQPAGKKPQQPRAAHVPDRQKPTHATEGGARGGYRGGRGGSRGGRGGATDGSVRQFDRRGAPTKHAPSHAAKDGAALGPQDGIDLHAAVGASVEDVVASADGVEPVVADMVFEDVVVAEDDGLKTYDEYLASKRLVEDEVQVREVQNDDSAFNKVKPLKREDDDEEKADENEEERAARKARKAGKGRQVVNLDEFRGGREADSKYRPSFDSSAPRGGRGGFVPRGRGGARGGAVDGARPPRTFDGGDRPRSGAPRGGAAARGAFVPRGAFAGRSSAAPVPINDKNAFPALGQ